MAKQAFDKKGELLHMSHLVNLRKCLVKTLKWSIALCGSEVWIMIMKDIKLLAAFEICIWRKMPKFIWTECIKSQE